MIKPMLAQNYNKQKKKIVYPCYVQPKLDGIRCLAHRKNGKMEYWSRNQKPLKNLEHFDLQLLSRMNEGEWLDGELYCHGHSFQDIVSWVKRKQENTLKIQYHVYDFVSDLDFETRKSLIPVSDGPIVKIHSTVIMNDDELTTIHKGFVEKGFEGTMIRNLNGPYKHGRSMDLQKRKDWFDEEYEIVDVVEGKKKFEGCAIFVCKNEAGTFACTSPGTLVKKREVWDNKESYIGVMLTVKYQEKTNKGIPRFPIAIAVRDYE